MITQIKGRLEEKTPTQVVIDCQGVGYAGQHFAAHLFSTRSGREH